MNSLRLTWLLAGLNLVALFLLFSVYVEQAGPGKYEAAAGKINQDMPTVPELTANTIGDISEILERPLFNEDRRPIEITEPVVSTKKTPANDTLDYKLVGVALLPENTQALLQTKKREIERVKLGERIDGWELTSVEADSVVLVKAGKEVQLMLERTSPTVKKTKRRFNPTTKRSKK